MAGVACWASAISPAHAASPVLAAAGDIACPPGEPTTAVSCRQAQTAALVQANQPDAVAVLGDDQYESGTLAEFNGSFDLSWGAFKGLIRPSAGNHEYETEGAAGYFSYFGAEAGDPSQGYYSFDLGDWHIVSLNSNCANAGCTALLHGATSDAQVAWLDADLDAHRGQCTLAYWHHPRFSSVLFGGVISSESPGVKPLWDTLYEHGADVILNGHAHVYERFNRQDTSRNASYRGIAQLIVGTGGEELHAVGVPKSNSAVRDISFGAVFLTLDPNGYSWQYKREDGTVADSGSLPCHKPVAEFSTSPTGSAGQPVSFDASGSQDLNGVDIEDYSWDFGDGTSGSGRTVSHTYATAGTRTVKLTVTNADGFVGTVSHDVTILPGETETPSAVDKAIPLPPTPRPRILHFSLTRSAFRPAPATSTRVRHPVGTTFRYRLSTPSRVRLTLWRLRPGRRPRWTRVGTLAFWGQAGLNRRFFNGRLKGRTLPAGRYRVSIAARSVGGITSHPRRLGFRLLAG